MKRQIRKGVFETNSSSTHAICISKESVNTKSLSGHVTFSHGEFGWENETYSDTWSKASYLYQAIYDCNDGEEKQEKLDSITEMLAEYGITCNFEPDKDKTYGNGYIDHAYETSEFVNVVLSSSERLMTYLFGDSFVITGNDNSDGFTQRMHDFLGTDEDGWEEYDYDHYKAEFDNYDVYEKGN